MALDGITIAAITEELRRTLTGARIYKIAQPEADELLITIKSAGGQRRLAISAGASLPFIYLTGVNKQSPMTAPGFCMLLRKHLQNGRIVSVTQPGLERIVRLEIEHLDELGDLCKKYLVTEIMGKHSNIIFLDDGENVIDSIKHISSAVSSVREVLPGRKYFIPQTRQKLDPFSVSEEEFIGRLTAKAMPLSKSLYMSFTGISPVMAEEIAFRASLDSDVTAVSLPREALLHLYHNFQWLMQDVSEGRFAPNIVYRGSEPVEYAAVPLTQYGSLRAAAFDSMSQVLESYYAEKNVITRIRQRSADLRRIVQTALERTARKHDLQSRQLKDTEKKDKFKVYGELINTYGYNLQEGARSMEALNYYTNEMMTVPLDAQLTPAENAQKYFEKYGKLKRTEEAVTSLLAETKAELAHLDSVSTALDMAMSEEDLVQIKEELVESGYIRRKGGGRREKITSRPYHYISSDGYHMYVGKNNFQNEELTFKFATGGDWWFHAKNMPGSHVIVKAGGETPPDTTFEEAGRLAAYYSKGRGGEKVEIDYIEKKHVKKPAGGKPGFVIYHTNYSLISDSDISGIESADA